MVRQGGGSRERTLRAEIRAEILLIRGQARAACDVVIIQTIFSQAWL